MKKLSLVKKIFIALILGSIFGLVLNKLPHNIVFEHFVLNGVIKLIGQAFTNLIKAMVVPLVLVSIILGTASIGDLKKLGSIGSKIVLFYIGTTILAVTLALFMAEFINPAAHQFHVANNFVPEQQHLSAYQIILDIIPTNPIQSLANGNMLQVIFFAVLFGIGITLVGEKASSVKKFLDSLNEINLKLISVIMQFAPIGVFALISYTFYNFGWDIISSLSKYVLVVYVALAIQAFVIYSLMFWAFTRLDIRKFWRKFAPVASIAFSTSSSNAALPVSMEAADKMGIARGVSSFTLSLGSTINMNGTAIMHGITVVFLAHIYNIDLTTVDFIKVICMSTLAAIGTAGVPGVGMLMLAMVLQLVNIPIEAIGLVLGIDRILDAGRTVVNVMGDCVCTLIVAKLENDLDIDKFNSNV